MNVDADVTATARSRSWQANTGGRIEYMSTRIGAAPTPITARSAIRPSGVLIWLATAEATPNSSSRLRPGRSPSTPAGGQQQAGQHQQAGVHHPLQLAGRSA